MRKLSSILAISWPLLAACSTPGAVRAPVAESRQELVHPVKSLSSEQVARLRVLLAELARPPFGTAATLSVSIGGQTVSLAEGSLWADGPAAAEDSRFNWASVSKLLTAAKVVALAHEGRISLDDSVRKHLPGITLVDSSGKDRASEITLRQLLMHRGGVPHQPGALDPRRFGSDWSDPDLLQKLASSWSVTLAQAPGTYSYSNLGYALLAAVIEKTEGHNFAEVMQTYLRELHMPDSTFWSGNLTERAAHGRVEQNGSVSFNAPGWYASRYALPFTGLWATTPDMARFGQALIAANADEHAPLHAMAVLDSDKGHGLGPVHRRRFGALSLEHDGSGPGFVAWLLAIPEHDVTLALACNGGGESREQGKRLFELTNEMLAVILGTSLESQPHR